MDNKSNEDNLSNHGQKVHPGAQMTKPEASILYKFHTFSLALTCIMGRTGGFPSLHK